MSENSKIEWCDHTLNFWQGCTKVAPGCLHCYAETWANRFGGGIWGPKAPRRHSPKVWQDVLRLNRKAAKAGRIDRVFVNSMSDFFEDHTGPIVNKDGQRLYWDHEDGGISTRAAINSYPFQNPAIEMPDLREYAFRVFDQCQSLIFMLLTKRPENIHRMWSGGRRENVWLMTSMSEQESADQNVSELLKCRNLSPVLGLSCEPLLGPVDLTRIRTGHWSAGEWDRGEDGVDWVIVGGESGRGAKPMHPDWARSIRDQCQAAGVSFFFKQWGEWLPFGQQPPPQDWHDETRWPSMTRDGMTWLRVGKKNAGRLLDGSEWSQFPTQEPSHAE